MDRTVAAAAAGRLANTGQSCVASKRFIVVGGQYDEVADRLDSGIVWINQPTSTQANLPFGGVKRPDSAGSCRSSACTGSPTAS